MFSVYEKVKTHGLVKAVNVYNVRDDKNGYPQFLICEDGEWKYRSAKHYTDKVWDIRNGD